MYYLWANDKNSTEKSVMDKDKGGHMITNSRCMTDLQYINSYEALHLNIL